MDGPTSFLPGLLPLIHCHTAIMGDVNKAPLHECVSDGQTHGLVRHYNVAAQEYAAAGSFFKRLFPLFSLSPEALSSSSSSSAAHVHETLDFIQLQPHVLTKQGLGLVEALASLAVLLNQRTTELSSFFSALTTLDAEEENLADKVADGEARLELLDERIHKANASKSRLQRSLFPFFLSLLFFFSG